MSLRNFNKISKLDFDYQKFLIKNSEQKFRTKIQNKDQKLSIQYNMVFTETIRQRK